MVQFQELCTFYPLTCRDSDNSLKTQEAHDYKPFILSTELINDVLV